MGVTMEFAVHDGIKGEVKVEVKTCSTSASTLTSIIQTDQPPRAVSQVVGQDTEQAVSGCELDVLLPGLAARHPPTGVHPPAVGDSRDGMPHAAPYKRARCPVGASLNLDWLALRPQMRHRHGPKAARRSSSR